MSRVPYCLYLGYTSDGCERYKCLSCKSEWEARYVANAYCSSCGVKFVGSRNPTRTREDKYELIGRVMEIDRAKRNTEARWVIEGKQYYHGKLFEDWLKRCRGGEWGVIWDEDRENQYGGMRGNCMHAYTWLRLYRRAEQFSRGDDCFVDADGNPWFSWEFRARLTADRTLPICIGAVEYPHDEKYWEAREAEREAEKLMASEGNPNE